MAIRVAVLVASDKAWRGERTDLGGPAVREGLAAVAGRFEVVEERLLPDEQEQIAAVLAELCERPDVDLVLTTGGTGLAPRDVTPQATRQVLDYDVPGIAEAIRAESSRITPAGMLSRGYAGVRSRTLVVNLPGSPKAVRELLPVILPALPHAVETLRGGVGDHVRPS